MSETMHYRGILTVVTRLECETLEEQCKRIMESCELDIFNDSYQEQLIFDSYERYVIRDDVLYLVEKKDVGDDSIFIITEGEDGAFNFEVRYYNGGCSFDEAIEYAFNNKQ
jgi:hypothetical protein